MNLSINALITCGVSHQKAFGKLQWVCLSQRLVQLFRQRLFSVQKDLLCFPTILNYHLTRKFTIFFFTFFRFLSLSKKACRAFLCFVLFFFSNDTFTRIKAKTHQAGFFFFFGPFFFFLSRFFFYQHNVVKWECTHLCHFFKEKTDQYQINFAILAGKRHKKPA